MIEKHQTIGSALLAAISLGAVLTAGCAAPPQTSASAPISAVTERQATPEVASDAVRLGLINRTTALIGKKVMTRGEKGLGNVEDLILDIPNGQVVAVLVTPGKDQQSTPVPARSFWTATKNKILVSTDRNTFESAPRLPKASMPQTPEAKRLHESFLHFGQRASEPSAAGSGGLCSAAELIGMRLVSRTQEPLGQIEDIMVDVPVGRIAYLVIQPAAGVGSNSNLYVLPPQAIRHAASGRSLVLETDQAHFLAGPHIQQDFWTEMSRPELLAAMLEHYSLQPGASGQPDPTRQPVRARIETPGAPAQGSPARSDQEITQAVVTEIVRINARFPYARPEDHHHARPGHADWPREEREAEAATGRRGCACCGRGEGRQPTQ